MVYTKKRGEALKRAGRICNLQEKIFCAFVELHYLKIFSKFINLDVIGFNPIQEIYYSILNQGERYLCNEKVIEEKMTKERGFSFNTEAIGRIIYSKIMNCDGLNFMYQKEEQQKKYLELAKIIWENKTVIFSKKPLISLKTIRKVNKQIVKEK